MDDKEQSKIAKSVLANMWEQALKIESILVNYRNNIEHAMDNGDDDSQLETCISIGDLTDKLERIYVLTKAIGYGCRP